MVMVASTSSAGGYRAVPFELLSGRKLLAGPFDELRVRMQCGGKCGGIEKDPSGEDEA